jgi:hypothetical protein
LDDLILKVKDCHIFGIYAPTPIFEQKETPIMGIYWF